MWYLYTMMVTKKLGRSEAHTSISFIQFFSADHQPNQNNNYQNKTSSRVGEGAGRGGEGGGNK